MSLAFNYRLKFSKFCRFYGCSRLDELELVVWRPRNETNSIFSIIEFEEGCSQGLSRGNAIVQLTLLFQERRNGEDILKGSILEY